ncbi:MAG: cell division protein SepF, partial [Promethearchaeota archaeon]
DYNLEPEPQASDSSVSSFFVDQLKQRTMFVKKLALNTMNDIPVIQNELSNGNITIVDVTGFVSAGEFTILELKRAIEQIRGTCRRLGGSLARLGERFLIATPNDKVQFGK